jgi:hypothetical protein
VTPLTPPSVRDARWRATLVVAALTVLAGVLRFWGLTFGLPRAMARPDEDAITATAAQIVLHGADPKFFDYPTLFMYLVAGVERMWPGGNAVLDDYLPTLIARSLSAALGTLSVPLLFLAVRKVASVRAATVAAALLTVAFLHVRDSHFGVTDVPMTFMVVLAFFAIVSAPPDRARWWNIVPAALACGLAISTKYNAAVIAAPLMVVMYQARCPLWMYGLVLAVMIGGFLAGTPYAVITPARFLAALAGLREHLDAGHGSTEESIGWIHHMTFSLRYGLGVAFLIAAISGGLWLVIENPRRAAVVLAFPLLYYIGMGSGRTVFMRHMVPMVPFASLLAGVFVDRVADVAARVRIAPRTIGAAVAVFLTIALGYDSALRDVALDRLLAQRDSRTIAAERLEARFPRGASVYQNSAVYGHVQLWPEGIFPETPLDRAPLLVILQTSPLVSYSDQPNGIRDRLRNGYRLIDTIEVERRGSSADPVFDQQDAFFVPVTGIERFIRPGPAIEIFERTGE